MNGSYGHRISSQKFESFKDKGPEQHLFLALNPQSSEFFEFYTKNTERPIVTEHFDIEEIKTERLGLDVIGIADAPIALARAKSDLVQSAYWGDIEPRHINLKHLSTFCNKGISFDQLPGYPHPLG